MARKTFKPETAAPQDPSNPNSKAAARAPRPIGVTATGKPTAQRRTKDEIDEASESSFPASDPPPNSTIAAGESAAS